ncbi:MAG: class I SAM-dependent methyltransferase [Kiloniellales bacterium]|nr:class I SAM-dependent methyltransferase [Kiloniellales bacterium]
MTKKTYERIAPFYNLLDAPHELTWRRRQRASLFEGLSGRILDAGVGTGRNVAFYPSDSRVVGIDKSPRMLRLARLESEKIGKPAQFLEMDVMRTAFPDRCFDGIVATLLFGILREDQQLCALTELARICKPCGSIRLLDYAMSRRLLPRLIMTLVKPWSLYLFDQRFDAKTEPHLADAGLEVLERRDILGDAAKILVLRPSSSSPAFSPGAASATATLHA